MASLASQSCQLKTSLYHRGLMVSEGNCDANLASICTSLFHDPVSKTAQTARMTSRWADKTPRCSRCLLRGPDKGIQDDVDHLQQAPLSSGNCIRNRNRNRN
ncbi:MAG: hypothetical protein ABIO17_07220 [Pseudoxanthomonas sp.]